MGTLEPSQETWGPSGRRQSKKKRIDKSTRRLRKALKMSTTTPIPLLSTQFQSTFPPGSQSRRQRRRVLGRKMTGRGEIPPRTRSNLQERVKRRNHTERRDLRSETHIAVINHINTR